MTRTFGNPLHSHSPNDFLLEVADDCFFLLCVIVSLHPSSIDKWFSDLQQGPSVAEMMVCLGPAEIYHRFQNLLRVCESS